MKGVASKDFFEKLLQFARSEGKKFPMVLMGSIEIIISRSVGFVTEEK